MKVWNADTARAYSHRLTPRDVQAIHEFQGGMCAICDMPAAVNDLVIDHDHVTDERRGLLCAGCNTSLAVLEKGAAWTQRALEYLADPPIRHVPTEGYVPRPGRDGNKRRNPRGAFYRRES